MLVRYSILELLMVFEVSAQREHTIVIDSLGGGHTHKHAYRSSRTEENLRNQARVAGAPGLKIRMFPSLLKNTKNSSKVDSCKNTFGVKKTRPSKVESYLKVST